MRTLLPFLILLTTSCVAQSGDVRQADKTVLVGAPCEGCEAVLEFGSKHLTPVDTLEDFDPDTPSLRISGTVYKQDGKTPAADVILYAYHTDQEGVYPTRGDESGWGRRHGYLRGWIRTDKSGSYTFYTKVPAHYPGRNTPKHIHMTVLEPDGKYYYIADFFFSDDPKLADSGLLQDDPRGGPGYVITPRRLGNLMVAERDIILGENVPGYEK